MASALTNDELHEILVEQCRSKTRGQLYGECVWGAVGLMARRLLKLRNDRVAARGGGDPLQDGQVATYNKRRHNVTPQYTRDFLSGNTPGDIDWGIVAAGMIAFILAADADAPEAFDEKRVPQAVRDLLHFLFLNNPQQHADPDPPYETQEPEGHAPPHAWYFGPFTPQHPTSTREVFAEWRFLGQRLAQGRISELRMVRLGCAEHFRMVMPQGGPGRYELAPAGKELLALLKAAAGANARAEQVFLYPADDLFSPVPRESFEAFRDEVQRAGASLGLERMLAAHAVELRAASREDPRHLKRFPFEYFQHQFRYVWYEWKKESGGLERRLWVSRHPVHGPCLFDADEDEKNLFADWYRLFGPASMAAQHPKSKVATGGSRRARRSDKA